MCKVVLGENWWGRYALILKCRQSGHSSLYFPKVMSTFRQVSNSCGLSVSGFRIGKTSLAQRLRWSGLLTASGTRLLHFAHAFVAISNTQGFGLREMSNYQ